MGLFAPNVAKLTKKGSAKKLVALLGYRKDERVAGEAMESVVELGEPCVEHLIAVLKAKEGGKWGNAAVALQRMGRLATVDPAVTNAILNDDAIDALCKIPVAEALAKSGNTGAIDRLIGMLRDPKLEDRRQRMADALAQAARMQGNPSAALQFAAIAERWAPVVRMMEIKHAIVKTMVVDVLAGLGPPAVAAVTAAARSPNQDIRSGAEATLQRRAGGPVTVPQ